MEKYILRELEKDIKRLLDVPEIIAIVGPRQSGKTTLIKYIAGFLDDSRITYISFEDQEDLNLFSSNIKG